MPTWLIVVIGIGLAFVLLVVVGLLVFQDSLVYVPDVGEPALEPEQLGFVAGYSYEDVALATPDGERLPAMFFRARAVAAGLRAGEPLRTEAVRRTPALLWLHANAGTLVSRLPAVRDVVARAGCSVLIVDYRGYGASTGAPSEAGLRTDAETALRWLRARADVDAAQIVVFGRSIGGAVAVHLATAPATATLFGALVLENTFTTLPDLARTLLPRPLRPLARFSRNQWRSLDRLCAHGVRVPTMFFAAVHDEMVPHAHMCALHAAARDHSDPALRPRIAIRKFLRGGHMTLPDANLMYYSWLHDWLAEVLPGAYAPLSPEAQAQLNLFTHRPHRHIHHCPSCLVPSSVETAPSPSASEASSTVKESTEEEKEEDEESTLRARPSRSTVDPDDDDDDVSHDDDENDE